MCTTVQFYTRVQNVQSAGRKGLMRALWRNANSVQEINMYALVGAMAAAAGGSIQCM